MSNKHRVGIHVEVDHLDWHVVLPPGNNVGVNLLSKLLDSRLMLAGVHHEREGHLCLGEFNSSTYFFDTEAPGQLIDVIVAALRELSLMKFAHIGCMDCTKPPPWVWHTVHQGRGPLVDFLDFVSEAAMQREHERIEQMNRRINKGQ